MLYPEWYQAQMQKIGAATRQKRAVQKKVAKYLHPVTERQTKALKALYKRVTFAVGSPDKRFVRDMHGTQTLTYGQALYLARLVYRYRKQLGLNNETATRLRDELNQDAEAIKLAAEGERNNGQTQTP